MEVSEGLPAPATRVASSADGASRLWGWGRKGGSGRRPQPHAGPKPTAQQQAAQDYHTLLQQTVASGWDRGLLGRQGSGQMGGDGQHQPVAAYARGFLAARLVPFPADRFETPEEETPEEAQFNPVAARGASKEASGWATGVSLSST